MRVYLRGIPHFGFVVSQETENFADFLNSLELRVSQGIFEAKADYYLDKKRVMVYLEQDDYSREVQSPADLYLKACPEDGRVTGAGIGGFGGGAEVFLFVEPKNDPRYPALLERAKEDLKAKWKQEEEEDARQERLRERLITLAERIGIEASIDILESRQ